MKLENNELLFAKVKPNAIIPTKRLEDAGRDVYACFEEDYMVIPAHSTVLIPTGIASAMSPKYEIRLRDRGSNGSKGIHVNAGTIDSGFRGEWFVAWCNTNSEAVVLSKLTFEELMDKYAVEVKNDFGGFIDYGIPKDPKLPYSDDNFEWFAFDYSNDGLFKEVIIYPYSKAIAQAEVCEVPVMDEKEVSYEELMEYKSVRGTDMLGSSGK